MKSRKECYILDVTAEELLFIAAMFMRDKEHPLAKILGTLEIENAKANGVSDSLKKKIKQTMLAVVSGDKDL